MAESDLIRGNVDTVILKVLYEGDRYGFDLIKQINTRSNGQWEIKQSTVYACLKRLEKQGFVSSYWDSSESAGGRRKYFSLTERGKEVFATYKNEWERSRDLFGELIDGSDPILPADDFSDVEEESYSVPKRRPQRTPRPRPKKVEVAPEATPVIEEEPPTVQQSIFDVASVIGTSEAVEPEPQPAPEPEPAEAKRPEPERFAEYANPVPTQSYSDYYPYNVYEDVREDYTARPAADPREILEKLYENESYDGESYLDARRKSYTDDREQKRAAALPVREKQQQPPAPVFLPETTAQTESMPAPQKENKLVPYEQESLARREYRDILTDLVDRLEVAAPVVRGDSNGGQAENYRDESAATATALDGGSKIEVRLYNVEQNVKDMGNDFAVRNHNNSAREYAQKYYYYSNKLLLTHYTIMCSAMFLLGTILFLTMYFGFGLRLPNGYDSIMYVLGGLLPIFMFIGAVIMFACNPSKKKRINVSFRFSIAIRIIIMVQVAVVIYCVNLIAHMPVGFSAAYIPSLVLPAAYALFIPISELIFMGLLKSGRYAVE